jgi:hypothetical protein
MQELRVQKVGENTYFHVRFALPSDMYVYQIEQWKASELQRRQLSRLPELVSQDSKACAIYPRMEIPDYRPNVGFDPEPTRPPVPVKGLEFVGKLKAPIEEERWGKFLLMYPIDLNAQAPRVPDRNEPPTSKGNGWAQIEMVLHFGQAQRVAELTGSIKRTPRQAPDVDDLEGLWAAAQAGRLAILEALTADFGFLGFACEATARKYGVRAPMLERGTLPTRDEVHRRLYETTTGSTAITESLQLHRMLNPTFRDKDQRTIDVAKVTGIDIAEHPWAKMMGDKKPSPEPLAKLVPHDNFYVHFKSIRKFIEFGELLDQWGTNLVRAYEMNSRDYHLKESYEKQLCLRSGWLGKTFGPAVVRSLAITGNDGYLREGSDVTVIFDVKDKKLFLSAVEQFVNEARKEFGNDLKETKTPYQGIDLESFVTPLREVSAHRAVIGDFVIYSNSRVALRRVIDVHQGRLKALADSLDFQYMRTVFRLEDELEDGFAFLSDAFIRQLVGPASKIKEKRRLEALTSLQMVTHGAMFAAWENGQLPADHQALLTASALRPAEIYMPEGQGVTWDAARQTAISDVYNTMHFPTPLVELPIDQITPGEEQEYRRFRSEYLNLWRRYFDPVGMRFSLNDRRVRLETYLLPLLQDSRYNFLREFAGGGTASLDPSRFSPNTLIQGTMHLAPWVRNILEPNDGTGTGKGGIGDWAMIRVDDTPAFKMLADLWMRREFDPQPNRDPLWDVMPLLDHFPLTIGIHVKDAKAFRAGLDRYVGLIAGSKPAETMEPYKGVSFSRVRPTNSPVLYHAFIDDAWYVSFSADSLKDLVDRWIERRDAKTPRAKEKPVPINGSVYIAPAAAVNAGDALRFYLEWESQRRALANCPLWYTLYRCGLIPKDASEKMKSSVARRFLGFLPVSPDGAEYCYDQKTNEIVNQRHGSLPQPHWHRGIEADSPLGRLLDEFRSLRADLRFQEDGVNTTVTIQRK